MPIDNPLPDSYREQVEQILPFYPISVNRFAPHTRKFRSAEDLLGMIALKSKCGQGVHAYKSIIRKTPSPRPYSYRAPRPEVRYH